MEPIISVLIPTYNRPFDLVRAVKSVLSQTCKNLEIIITDNSIDNKSELLIKDEFEEFSNIIYERNTCNIGPILNWKKALNKAKGKYCIILPDDDFLINPFYLEDGIEILTKNKLKLLFTSCVLGYENKNNSIAGRSKSEIINGIDFINGFWDKYNIPTIANIFETVMAREFNSFNDNKILYSDLEFWLKSLAFTNVYFYNIPSVYYSFHDTNIVTNMNHESLIQNSKFILNTIDFFKKNKIEIDYNNVKNNLTLNYVKFTSTLYSFISIKYFLNVAKINDTSFYNLGYIKTALIIAKLNYIKFRKFIK